MAAQDTMIAAVNQAEGAVVALANAYAAYTAGHRAAAQAISTSDPRMQAVAELESAVGPERLAQFVYGRLVTLGAERILAQLGAERPTGAEWTSYLTAQIEHHVPEAAAVRAR